MKYGTATSTATETGGGSAPQQFSIQNSAIAFETLSSRLYSDPVRAVIRELSCNAYDAHIMTERGDKPFVVQLPTSFDPSFKIRDFGPGMSDDEIMQLYCTYFASNKREDNKVIGALGLGSKSPFAYFLHNGTAGGFAVTSYQGGTARTYQAYIDEGYPKVKLQDEQETTEPDGLKVEFPVEQNHILEFENKAKAVFEFFAPQPTLNKELNVARPIYVIEAKKWGLRQNPGTAQGSGVRAIMGTVAYAVGTIDVSRLTDIQQAILLMPLDIFFEIGEVSPASSRETLQLDSKTIAAIQGALDGINAEILEQVRQKIDAADNLWEGRLVVYRLLTHHAIAGIVNHAFNGGLLGGQYTHFTLEAGKDITLSELDYGDVRLCQYVRGHSRNSKPSRYDRLRMTPEEREAARKSIRAGDAMEKSYQVAIEVNPSVVIILDDMKPGRASRYVSYFVQNKGDDNPDKRNVYMVSAREDADQDRAAKEMARLLAAMGHPPTMLASSLVTRYFAAFPKRESIPHGRGLIQFDERPSYYGRYEGGGSSKWRNSWSKADESVPDQPGKKYYVVVAGSRREALTGISGLDSPAKLRDFLGHLRSCGCFGMEEKEKLYGLRANSRLRKDASWVELKPLVEAEIKRTMSPAKELALSLLIKPFSSNWDFVINHVANTLPLDPSSALQKFAVGLASARKRSGGTGVHLAAILETIGYKATNVTDFNALWKGVVKQYPLLDVCQRRGYGTGSAAERKALVAYMKMIDKSLVPMPPPEPDKPEAYRVRKTRNQKRYYENRKRREQEARIAPDASAEAGAPVAEETAMIVAV